MRNSEVLTNHKREIQWWRYFVQLLRDVSIGFSLWLS